jgi:ADP-ribose pyrophosphatase
MKFLWLCLLATTCFASDASRQEYLTLIELNPNLVTPRGNSAAGEIEILTSPTEMAAIEKKTGRDVGVVKRDKYWIWINDACRFPSGQEGVYGRILWLKALDGSISGVAVMPILPDGNVVLNLNYRHATRSWEIELPRGGLNLGETVEAAARREALEETGMKIGSLKRLGEIPPDSGLTSTVVPIFEATVVAQVRTDQEDTEAIADVFSLSLPQIKQAFRDGYYVQNRRKAFFRDPFLAYAVLLYEMGPLSSPSRSPKLP